MATDPNTLQQATDAAFTAARTADRAGTLQRCCNRLLVAARATFSPVDPASIEDAIAAGEDAMVCLTRTLGKLRAMQETHPSR
jgi:hypothetical protein